MKNYLTNTRFSLVPIQDSGLPNFDQCHLIKITDNINYPEIANTDRKYFKDTDIQKLTVHRHEEICDENECDGCCPYCWDGDISESLIIPVYSYAENWERNRRVVKNYLENISWLTAGQAVRFINQNRTELNKTCGRRWTNKVLGIYRKKYFKEF